MDTETVRQEINSYKIINYEVVDVIKRLKNRYKLIVLSDAPTRMVEEIITDNNLADLFDSFVISSTIGMVKPTTGIFEYLLTDNGLSAPEVLFIDDNPRNVNAAHALGMNAVLFTGIDHLKLELAKHNIIQV
jgi:putative hydrolase of the HAD superfamily